MCGVFGSTDPSASARLTLFQESLQDRGPDEFIFSKMAGCSLGFSRLSIVGISDGSQPIFDSEGQYPTVMNGEIYNYSKLISEFQLSPSNKSDAAVIPELYRKIGDSCFSMLEGMYAIALHDQKLAMTLLVRDLLGKKPLYYTLINNELWFCSKIQPLFKIRKTAGLGLVIDSVWLGAYLAFGHGEHLENSVFEGISRVLPGEVLAWKKTTAGKIEKSSYILGSNYSENENTSTANLWDSFSSSVFERVPNETSFGLQLSAGLDSSLVAVSLNELGVENFEAFTLESGRDEASAASALAGKLGFSHEVVFMPSGEDLVTKIEEAFGLQDEPIWDGYFTSYILNERVSKSHKVAISGDGPDELFFGYPRTMQALRLLSVENVLKKVSFLPPLLARALSKTKPGFSNYLRNWLHSGLDFPSELYVWSLASVGNMREDSVLAQWWTQLDNLMPRNMEFRYGSPERFIHEMELKVHLPQILKKVDQSSMSHGLEVRSPYLSNAVLTYAKNNIPKHRDIWNKGELRAIGKSKLPPEHIQRKKSGFGFSAKNLFSEPLVSEGLKIGSRDSPLLDLFHVEDPASIQTTSAHATSLTGRLYALHKFLVQIGY